MDRITHGPHKAWVSHPRSWIKLGALRTPSLTTTSLLAGLNAWTASRMPCLWPLFFKQVFKFTKTGRFVSWTFCILDVLYPGCSVTGRLVTGHFVTGRYATGRFVGEPHRLV
jgi:hypothetical protein